MLTTSVAVVRKIDDAVAGSAPSRWRVVGTSTPEMPLTTHAIDHREPGHAGEHPRLRVVLHPRVDEHPGAGRHADQRAVEEPEDRLLGHRRGRAPGLQLPERHAAQRDRERLAAGVARLPREHRQEHGEQHDLLERALEEADHRRGDEGGEQVELQPRVAEHEAARPGRGEPLLLGHADHRAGLRGELDRLRLEHPCAAHRALSAGPRRRRPDRPGKCLSSVSFIASSSGIVVVSANTERSITSLSVCDFAREQQVAHRDDADELAVGLEHPRVGDERVLDQLAKRLDRLADRLLRAGTPRAAAPSGGRSSPPDTASRSTFSTFS